jgi:aflatoxin B1 aldehyde reductase
MLGRFLEFGHDQIDTCHGYGDGSCEQMLGDLRAAERFGTATRFLSNNRGHKPENLKRTFKESLALVKTGTVKILYLVMRDNATPIASTQSAVQELHDEGLFEEFGVSNFSAWGVRRVGRLPPQVPQEHRMPDCQRAWAPHPREARGDARPRESGQIALMRFHGYRSRFPP